METQKLKRFKLTVIMWILLKMFLPGKVCNYKMIFFPLNNCYDILECSHLNGKGETQAFWGLICDFFNFFFQ